MDTKGVLPRLQLLVYLLETSVLTILLAIAAAGSAEFALGPLGRILLAASVPLPCHLILATHMAWARRAFATRASSALRIRPLPFPLPAGCNIPAERGQVSHCNIPAAGMLQCET